MNTIWTGALALALIASSAGAERIGRGGGGRDGSAGGGRGEFSGIVPRGSSPGPSPVYRMHRVTVPRPSMPAARPSSAPPRVAVPRRDGAGAPIVTHGSSVPPAHHRAVARDPAVVRGIAAQQRTEIVPKRFYWHNEGGYRYAHYYDGRDHWYGFYHGPSFYWARYYGDRWWWWDARFGRWDFWWDGFWWWPGPGVVYAYVDNAYYPYEEGGVTVENPVVESPPATPPDTNAGKTVASPDGTRVVQIFGGDNQAFLYEKSGGQPPTFLKYLGQGVDRVRFTGGTIQAPLQLLVEFKDDSFALFDADGKSLNASVESLPTQTAAPLPPSSIPPPPTKAPGR